MPATQGVLYVHSCPPALCPHVESAVSSEQGTRASLQWTAQLFRAPEGAPARHRVPAPLTAALALTGVLGVVLSGAPQLVLRFAGPGLF